MHTTHTHGDRGAVDLVADCVRRAIAGAAPSTDIQTILDRARTALVEADGVSLFSLQTPHPVFGEMHWIVGRGARPGADYLVLAIPGRAVQDAGWTMYAAGSSDLDTALRQLTCDFVVDTMADELDQPRLREGEEPELLTA
ncbi:hypothetical protein EDC22_110114 [Tepidamorphus gemmatus]|uniref:Uncharacterized protein n=1 Tax=Tepidamorphus gemmatus TaxID=747076 RepID=A0A4R3M6T5_9HYPH|nr:hypothetical protein [Tepidamorphus gemmatus]TCT07267.1 hypothetical protein EDC22_110114 [Tepidamorphus gemmatus]